MARVVVKFGINQGLIKNARRRGWQAVIREALRRAALWWFEKILPRHFDEKAYRWYPDVYMPRAETTEDRKRKRLGGRIDPMVWSGEMRRAVLGGRPRFEQFKARGSMRVRLRLPYHEHMKWWKGRLSPTGWAIDFREELTVVAGGERNKIRRMIERNVRELVGNQLDKAPQQVRTHTAGG